MLDDKLLSDYHNIEAISNDEEPDRVPKVKVVSVLESKDSFHSDSPAAKSIATRCRYKTGRCMNARDRAKKRLVERQQATKSRGPAKSQSNTSSGGVGMEKSMKSAPVPTNNSTSRHHRCTYQESPRSPGQPEKLRSPNNLFQHSACELFSEAMTNPAGKYHHDRSFVYSSSSVRDSKHYKHHHYHPFRTTTIHSSELHIDVEDSDTEATDSGTTEPIAGGVDVTSSVFPLCMSPLYSTPRWREVVHWQPDDVQLLEYFIL